MASNSGDTGQRRIGNKAAHLVQVCGNMGAKPPDFVCRLQQVVSVRPLHLVHLDWRRSTRDGILTLVPPDTGRWAIRTKHLCSG